MVENRKYDTYIDGSVALAPKPREIEYERRKIRKIRKRKVNWKIKYLKNTLIISSIGTLLMFNQVGVFNQQKQLARIETQIESVEKENSALQINLLKSQNIRDIEAKAKDSGMISVEKSNVSYKNLNTNYFPKYEEPLKKDSIISVLMRFIK